MIFLERFILGGGFFLLLLFGLILLFLKDGIVRSPKMHRYLGVSTILLSCSMLSIYLRIVCPDAEFLAVLETILAVVAIVVYAYILYNIVTLLLKKITDKDAEEVVVPAVKPAESKVEEHAVKEPVVEEIVKEEPKEEPVVEEAPVENVVEEKPAEEPIEETPEEVTEEPAEEDDKDATDENGELVPQPSENNMDDLIFFQRLEALMAKKKLFTEQEITREEIACEIGTNRTYLIRSIKFATGMTFNEYITSLRINYAAKLLITTDEGLDFIGTIAGFRSKSAYYRAFAAANNCTPSEYRNRNKE